MALRKILTDKDEALHRVCRPVEKFDEKLAILIDDMHQTLDKAQGVGLASPQIGVCRRVFIMHLEDEGNFEFINPEIISKKGKQRVQEGCLSCPDVWAYVTRPAKVKIKAQDRNGNWFEKTFTGLGAQCVCHENDHLDGHVFTEIAEEFIVPEESE